MSSLPPVHLFYIPPVFGVAWHITRLEEAVEKYVRPKFFVPFGAPMVTCQEPSTAERRRTKMNEQFVTKWGRLVASHRTEPYSCAVDGEKGEQAENTRPSASLTAALDGLPTTQPTTEPFFRSLCLRAHTERRSSPLFSGRVYRRPPFLDPVFP